MQYAVVLVLVGVCACSGPQAPLTGDATNADATSDGTPIDAAMDSLLPAAATQLVFLDPPSNVIAGAPFAPSVRVAAEDAAGNVIASTAALVTLDLVQNPDNAQIGGTSSEPLINGIATFSDIHIDIAGTGYTMRTSTSTLTETTSAPFDVSPGSPDAAHSSLVVSPPSVEADGVSQAGLAAHIANAYGAPIANVQVGFTVTGSNNTLVPASMMTSAAGYALASLTSTKAEAKTVTATAGSVTLTASVDFYPASCKPQLPGPPWSTLDATPDAVLVKDVDGDGHQDVVISVPGHAIAIYRGHGDGSFYPPFQLPTATSMHAMATGDVDGDGTLDLVMCQAYNVLNVARGIGGGQFVPGSSIQLDEQGDAIALGDFDRNGTLDVAVSIHSFSEIEVLMGAGDGTFAPGVTLVSDDTTNIATTDVNHDGKLDLIYDDGATLFVALGDGTGGFATPKTSTELIGGGLPFLADLDRDGNVDVLTTDSDRVAVMLGNGDGTFHQAGGFIQLAGNLYDDPDYAMIDSASFVDIDGDGDLDVIAESSSTLSILTNAGDGTLSLGSHAFLGGLQMATGDLDEDGIADVVALGPHSFGMLRGEPSGRFLAPEVYPRRDGRLYPAAVDFDGNGLLDVVRYDTVAGLVPGLTNADGSVTDAPVGGGGEASSVVLEDATGDGNLDLVYVDSTVIAMFPGHGDGTFATSSYQTILDGRTIAGGTFGPDSRADLVITAYLTNGFWIAQAQVDGSFAISPMVTSPTDWVVVGDVNHDGISDVLTADANSLLVYLGDGLGGVAAPISYPANGWQGTLELADVDGDSALDAVMLSTNPTTHVTSIVVLRGLSDGSFGPPLVTPAIAFPADIELQDPRLADFTGDGVLDLAVSTDHGFAIIGGFGDGYFRQHAWYYGMAAYSGTPAAPNTVISDRNRDGAQDLTFSATRGIIVGLDTGCVP